MRRTESLSRSPAHQELTSSRNAGSHAPLSTWFGPNSQAHPSSLFPPHPQLVRFPLPIITAPSVAPMRSSTLGRNAPACAAPPNTYRLPRCQSPPTALLMNSLSHMARMALARRPEVGQDD